jgi:methylmalonyl-CoA decarboxylase
MALVESEQHDDVGIITLNHPEKRNALSQALVDEAIASMETLHSKRVRAIILRAPRGSKIWSAGHDVRELPQPGRDRLPLGYDDPLLVSIRKIQHLPVPVIAMIDGAVYGGACDLAFSCDILIGSPNASFTMTPARIGVPYNVTGILHFLNLMPTNVVREMFFTALPMRAEQAHRMGILNDLVPAEQLEEHTMEKARAIARNSPLSIGVIKDQIRQLSQAHPLSPQVFERIQGLRRHVFESQDYREGLAAFFEKRPPVFEGR